MAVFVGTVWIVGVVAAWWTLRLGVLGGYARIEQASVEAKLDQARHLLDLRLRSFGREGWELATDPTIAAWLADPMPRPEPEALKGAGGSDTFDVLFAVDAAGTVRARKSAEGAGAAAAILLAEMPEVGVTLLDSPQGPLVVAVRPVNAPDGARAGTVVTGWQASEDRLAEIGTVFGLALSADAGGIGADGRIRPVSETEIAGDTTLALPDGTGALALHGTSDRALYNGGKQVFSLMLLGYAVVTALAGLLAVRLVPRLLHRESARLYEEFVEKSGEGLLLVEPETLRIRQSNGAVRRFLRRPEGFEAGMTLPEVLPLSPTAVIMLRGLLGSARAHLGEISHRPDNDVNVQLEIAASRMSWRDEDVLCVVVRDVTARAVEEARTRHLAWHDLLTGLPNRAMFQERLAAAVAAAAARGVQLGVAFVDVDQFKELNDTFGHDLADRLLIDVAQRLREGVRGGDIVARQGGDEFLVALPNVTHRAEASALAERLLALFRKPFNLDGREIHLTASVGVSMYPEDGRDAAELVKHADMAMYQAKEAGRDGWQLFDPQLNQRTATLVDTRARLVHALERNEFVLHYQPQVDLRSGQVIGVEALIRWMSDGRMVPPMEFIPVAEQTGLIAPIGSWVLHEAARQAKAWMDAGLPPVRMAVNLSARQFLTGSVHEAVSSALAASGLDPKWLEVEITESLAMKNPEVARSVLSTLREEGVTVALDDFGTGYSSLAYLRQFPIDRLKIDRQFLANAAKDPEQRALVGAIIQLAHAIKLEVVAEGIETASQLDVLAEDGCDTGQGFGLCKPVPAEEIHKLLAERLNLKARLRPRLLA